MSADGHHQVEEVVVDGISSLDEPSVGWGWHGHNRKIGQAAGWFFVVFLLCMLVGNHKGHVEDIWLVAIAVLIAIGLLMNARSRKVDPARKNRVFEVQHGDHYTLHPAPRMGTVAGSHATATPGDRVEGVAGHAAGSSRVG